MQELENLGLWAKSQDGPPESVSSAYQPLLQEPAA